MTSVWQSHKQESCDSPISMFADVCMCGLQATWGVTALGHRCRLLSLRPLTACQSLLALSLRQFCHVAVGPSCMQLIEILDFRVVQSTAPQIGQASRSCCASSGTLSGLQIAVLHCHDVVLLVVLLGQHMCTVSGPFAGVLTQCCYQQGQLLPAGQDVCCGDVPQASDPLFSLWGCFADAPPTRTELGDLAVPRGAVACILQHTVLLWL